MGCSARKNPHGSTTIAGLSKEEIHPTEVDFRPWQTDTREVRVPLL
jgi:hypothetical protein